MRPELNKNINPDEFSNYYWLKEELIGFCKSNGLPAGGGKADISDRIVHFLRTGEVRSVKVARRKQTQLTADQLSPEAKIPEGYKNDQVHRTFFTALIGEHFKFNTAFMNWMKTHAGYTYSEAVDEWKRIFEEKKQGKKTVISSQFEYNQYTRDFFAATTGFSRHDAIKCWKYKKSLPGHNRYEDSDLSILEK